MFKQMVLLLKPCALAGPIPLMAPPCPAGDYQAALGHPRVCSKPPGVPTAPSTMCLGPHGAMHGLSEMCMPEPLLARDHPAHAPARGLLLLYLRAVLSKRPPQTGTRGHPNTHFEVPVRTTRCARTRTDYEKTWIRPKKFGGAVSPTPHAEQEKKGRGAHNPSPGPPHAAA